MNSNLFKRYCQYRFERDAMNDDWNKSNIFLRRDKHSIFFLGFKEVI